mgnify:CR=1 FL=1
MFNPYQKLDPSQFNYNIYQDAANAEFLFGRSIQGFAEVLKSWEGFEKFVAPLEAYRKNYQSKVLKTYKENRSEFGYNVLNHADFHIRNLLFKKNASDAIEDFLFVSFSAVSLSIFLS